MAGSEVVQIPDALCAWEAQLRQREAELEARELAFRDREAALEERESVLERKADELGDFEHTKEHEAAIRSKVGKAGSQGTSAAEVLVLDVPRLVNLFDEGTGEPEIDMTVEVVERAQMAVTKLHALKQRQERQQTQLEQRRTHLEEIVRLAEEQGNTERAEKLKRGINSVEYRMEKMRKSIASSSRRVKTVQDEFEVHCDRAIERFTPALLKHLARANAVFERICLQPQQEEDLKVLEDRMRSVADRKSGASLVLTGDNNNDDEGEGLLSNEVPYPDRPFARPEYRISTLLHLLGYAILAGPQLHELSEEVIRRYVATREHAFSRTPAHVQRCSRSRASMRSRRCRNKLPAGVALPKISTPNTPTKGVRRCLAKAYEEYGGDFTRILDLARLSIVCTNVTALLAVFDGWMELHDEGRFPMVRIKDRMSRRYNAEFSGGSRDVMINGVLDFGRDRRLIVEVQLHLRELYAQKHEMHGIYNSIRVLGAFETAVISHFGRMNDTAIELASRGIVRKLNVPHCVMSAQQVRDLINVLHQSSCTLLTLDVSNAEVHDQGDLEGKTHSELFKGKTLATLFIAGPGNQTIYARRLQRLSLNNTGLEGPFPVEMGQLESVNELFASRNALSGPLPSSLSQCRHLESLNLEMNQLTGPIPSLLHLCPKMRKLKLNDNRFEGPVPPSLGEVRHLECIELHNNQLSGSVPAELAQLSSLEYLDLTGNAELRISEPVRTSLDEHKANVRAALELAGEKKKAGKVNYKYPIDGR